MKKTFLYHFFLLCTIFSGEKKPNILFFLVDDMGVGDTSLPFLYKNGKVQKVPHNNLYRTPNMIKLATKGRIFTNAYSYSICSPTRVSLMTGQSAPRHRVTTWTHPKKSSIDTGRVKSKLVKSPPNWSITGLDHGLPLLPRLMKKAGYQTLFAGKAHFGPDDTIAGNPLNLGFDVNIGGFGGGGPGAYHGKHNYSANWRSKNNHIWDVPGLEKYHGTNTFLTEAITLEMNQEISNSVKMNKPFFAYMSHYAVHAPYETDERFKANYPKLKGHALAFATLVEGMDKSLGDMVAHLEKLGVAEETLIIFFSDNGSTFNMNSPFRDKKGSRYEGGMRVPLIVAWAKPNAKNSLQQTFTIPQNSVDHNLVTCIDMMPTILKIANAPIPQSAIIDGFDISPYFQGETGIHRPQEFLTHFPHRHQNTLYSTFRLKEWKIIYNYASEKWELYNLEKDPFERKNEIYSNPELSQTMAKKMILKLDAQKALYPLSVKTNRPVKPNLNKL